MPVTSSVVSVGTAVVELSGPFINAKLVYLQDGDFDGDTVVYVGGSDVTTSTGVKLSKTNTTVFQTNGDDSLYGICSAEGGSVRVVEVK
jgi:hypothetical protein